MHNAIVEQKLRQMSVDEIEYRKRLEKIGRAAAHVKRLVEWVGDCKYKLWLQRRLDPILLEWKSKADAYGLLFSDDGDASAVISGGCQNDYCNCRGLRGIAAGALTVGSILAVVAWIARELRKMDSYESRTTAALKAIRADALAAPEIDARAFDLARKFDENLGWPQDQRSNTLKTLATAGGIYLSIKWGPSLLRWIARLFRA